MNVDESGQPGSRLKLVLVGDANVGKTSIINRLVDNTFEPGYFPTIGCPMTKKDFECGDINIAVEIFDTTGVQDYIGITSIQLRGSQIVVFVCSFDDEDTISSIPKSWIPKIDDSIDPSTYLKFLILNKSDIDIPNQEEMVEQATTVANDIGVRLLPVSAKSGDGITEAFQFIVESAYDHFCKSQMESTSGIDLSEALRKQKEKSTCC